MFYYSSCCYFCIIFQANTIFTNVAQTEDGRVYWEGLEKDIEPEEHIKTWLDEDFMVSLENLSARCVFLAMISRVINRKKLYLCTEKCLEIDNFLTNC